MAALNARIRLHEERSAFGNEDDGSEKEDGASGRKMSAREARMALREER
jgi:hypothetical protein